MPLRNLISRSHRRRRSTVPATAAEVLEDRRLLTRFIFTGTDAGPVATVKSFADLDDDGVYETFVSEIQPFGKYRGGVRVATGDFDGDRNSELVLALGENGRSRIDIYEINGDGSFGTRIEAFKPFGASHDAGVNVATGDLDGDGIDELIVGGDVSDTIVSKVRIYSDTDQDGKLHGNLIQQYAPFGGNFTGGVSIAAVDTDLAGGEELALGHGRGGSSLIRMFRLKAGRLRKTEQFRPFPKSYVGGVNLAGGSITNQRRDLIVGMATRGSEIVIRNDTDQDGLIGDDPVFESFKGFPNDVNGGVRVAGSNSNNGRWLQTSVIVAPGRGNVANVRVFKDDDDSGPFVSDNDTIDRFRAFTQEVGVFKKGVFLATGHVYFGGEVALGGTRFLPGGGESRFTHQVPAGAGRIDELTVTLMIDHQDNDHLDVFLVHRPTNTFATLFTDVGYDDDGIYVHFEKSGSSIGSRADDPNDRPITGYMAPEGGNAVLEKFEGIDASGTWELIIFDDDPSGHSGRLIAWTLGFYY